VVPDESPRNHSCDTLGPVVDPDQRPTPSTSAGDITRILSQIEQGEPQAAEQLLPLVYEELRKLAAARMAREKPGQTLQATALVHEAYLRIVDDAHPATARWDSRSHFYSAAAEAMRRILVENARHKKPVKNGGEFRRQELVVDIVADERVRNPVDLIALDEALTHLSKVDERAAEVVKLRYFAGLTNDEAARVLGMSVRTAQYAWTYARSWLHHALRSD
jgi:RNA polymerase sigma factor (TIGR02999 family)